PRTRPSGCETQSDYRASVHFRRRIQWIGVARHLDRQPSKSPREGGHNRRRVQPSSRGVLVGSPTMAVSVATLVDGEVVSGSYPDALYDLGQASSPYRHRFALFWLFSLWLERSLLGRGDPSFLLSSHAGLRQQSSASQAGTCGRRRFQPEHMVARPFSTHGVGRELAWQSS